MKVLYYIIIKSTNFLKRKIYVSIVILYHSIDSVLKLMKTLHEKRFHLLPMRFNFFSRVKVRAHQFDPVIWFGNGFHLLGTHTTLHTYLMDYRVYLEIKILFFHRPNSVDRARLHVVLGENRWLKIRKRNSRCNTVESARNIRQTLSKEPPFQAGRYRE